MPAALPYFNLTTEFGKKYGKLTFSIIALIVTGVFVITNVTTSGCRPKTEDFENQLNFQDAHKRVSELQTKVTQIHTRVCKLDSKVTGGAAMEIERTITQEVGASLNQDEFMKQRDARVRDATIQAKSQRQEKLGVGCNGVPYDIECFTDSGSWNKLLKDLEQTSTKLRVATIVLYKWVSPNTRALAKKGIKEGFADISAISKFLDTCPINNEIVSHELIQKVSELLVLLESMIPEIILELNFCEEVFEAGRKRAERLERGEYNQSDVAMGNQEL